MQRVALKETPDIPSASLHHDHANDDPLHGHNLDPKFFAHAQVPQNMGQLPDANGRAVGIGSCGDQMEVTLEVADNTIRRIRHLPRGCVYTVACGSAMTHLAAGRRLEEALALTPEQVAEELGGLPEDHRHCAALAINTLGEAIDDYYQTVWGARAKTGTSQKPS
ncbi:MAG: iron-sulfur cluster assembly scaffold protein [Deltaproteobacteria bacterium]|nr:iron-sulfur cluster assembly scaffold protein [Deltaproteobacteria bacterium]